MKNLKLNQLEKSEMNKVRGGEPDCCCYANSGYDVPKVFESVHPGIPWELRRKVWAKYERP